MKRSLTALVLAGSLAAATIATPTDAQARRLRALGLGVGAFAIGALVGAALARPYYARSYYYYPGYSYGYAYPAYSYGYAYPAYGYYGGPLWLLRRLWGVLARPGGILLIRLEPPARSVRVSVVDIVRVAGRLATRLVVISSP